MVYVDGRLACKKLVHPKEAFLFKGFQSRPGKVGRSRLTPDRPRLISLPDSSA